MLYEEVYSELFQWNKNNMKNMKMTTGDYSFNLAIRNLRLAPYIEKLKNEM